MHGNIIHQQLFSLLFALDLLQQHIIAYAFGILLSLKIKTITPTFICQIMGEQINCPFLTCRISTLVEAPPAETSISNFL